MTQINTDEDLDWRKALGWFLLALVVCILTACASGKEPPAEPTAKDTKWGCEDLYSLLQLPDGRTVKLCGQWGGDGTKIAGCWEAGAKDTGAGEKAVHLVCRPLGDPTNGSR